MRMACSSYITKKQKNQGTAQSISQSTPSRHLWYFAGTLSYLARFLISDRCVAGGTMYEVLRHHWVTVASMIHHSYCQCCAVGRLSNGLSLKSLTHPDTIVSHLYTAKYFAFLPRSCSIPADQPSPLFVAATGCVEGRIHTEGQAELNNRICKILTFPLRLYILHPTGLRWQPDNYWMQVTDTTGSL